ncbi:Arginine N-methyltransferase 2 [Exophiala dermatitidis]|nr:Arginine N-methyltransferase 2 [Exophiala dermatitidis]
MSTQEVTAPDGQSFEEQIREIIQAAAAHDIKALEACISKYSFPDCKAVDVQDLQTGQSPLRAAIASCRPTTNGVDSGQEPADVEVAAAETVRFLLENGAIWNQLDNNDETPGCIAHRLGLDDLYQMMVDAGVRAEMLLSRLEEYERLGDDEEAEADKADDDDNAGRPSGEEQDATDGHQQDDDKHDVPDTTQDVTSSAYLSSTLALSNNKLLDEQHNGVMMAWESGIMKQSADALLSEPGMNILNIGFGMGIIDSYIQNHANQPANHHIVEAHPSVLEEMKSKGWMDKPNVVVHSGKWQDVLPQLVAEGETFDAIYFDTFAESYSDFRDFFQEQVIGLLNQHGRWSFFNGMGADRQISYDVYQKVVEMDLLESGFDVEWQDVPLPDLEQEWDGVRRKYWNVTSYRLPVHPRTCLKEQLARIWACQSGTRKGSFAPTSRIRIIHGYAIRSSNH